MKELTTSEYNEISKFLAVGIKLAGASMKFSFKKHHMPDVISDGWLKFTKSYDKKPDDCPDASWAVRIGKFTGQDFIRKFIAKEKPLVSIEELGVQDQKRLAMPPTINNSQISVDMNCDFNTSTTAAFLSQGWGIEEIAEQLDKEPKEIVNIYIKNIKNVLENNKK